MSRNGSFLFYLVVCAAFSLLSLIFINSVSGPKIQLDGSFGTRGREVIGRWFAPKNNDVDNHRQTATASSSTSSTAYKVPVQQRKGDGDVDHPKVPVEFFIMSQCPDAGYCIRNLILPVMANISHMIDLQPSFIGQPDESNDGIACMHGPNECLGDMFELCAFKLYQDKPHMWLPFYDCMFEDYGQIPKKEYMQGCASRSGMSFEDLNRCASDDGNYGGWEMLRRDARRSQELGITTSCTITVVGKVRCVRDGGEWKDCKGGSSVNALKKDIEELYNSGDWDDGPDGLAQEL